MGTVNGWTNDETWLVGMWIGSDERTQAHWQDTAGICYRETDEADTQDARYFQAVRSLSEALKEIHEDELDRLVVCPPMWRDMLDGALSVVNWREIAEHMIDESRG